MQVQGGMKFKHKFKRLLINRFENSIHDKMTPRLSKKLLLPKFKNSYNYQCVIVLIVFKVQKAGQVFGTPATDVRDRVFSQRSVVRPAADRALHPRQVTGTSHPGNHSSRRLFRYA